MASHQHNETMLNETTLLKELIFFYCIAYISEEHLKEFKVAFFGKWEWRRVGSYFLLKAFNIEGFSALFRYK